VSAGGAELLRALGAGVRPVDAVPSAVGQRGGGSDVFGSLLEAARAGSVRTDLPVSVDRGVALVLSDGDRARIGAAIDTAAGLGARRAAVLFEGRVLTVDAQDRRIVAAQAAGKVESIGGIDAVVRVGPPNANGPAVAKTDGPGGGTGGRAGSALLAALGGRSIIGRS
jgi:hypothetical protein